MLLTWVLVANLMLWQSSAHAQTPFYQGKTITLVHGRSAGGSGDVPELDGFAKSERERKIVTLYRNFSLTGAPFILPPAMAKDRIEIIKEALRKTFKDPAFLQEYRKLVGDEPSPFMPEENEKAIRELPRDKETVELYKKFAGAGPIPAR